MRKYGLVITIIVVLNFLIRIPFFNFPAHWDEIAYFWGAWKVFNNNFNPFVEFWSYKPPLIFEITAFLYKFFGPSLWPGRLIVALFSSLGIFFTYKIGGKFFNKKVGFWAAVLLFLNPLYFTQSNLFHVEILLTTLFLVTIYFYFSKKITPYLIFASLLVLTKEPAILIIFSLVIFDIVFNFKKLAFREVIKREAILISPIIVFIGWMLLNKKFLGWYLWPYNVSYFTLFNRPYSWWDFNAFFSVSFQEHFLWFIFGLPLFALLFSLGFPSLKKKLFKKEILFLFSLAIVFPFIFYFSAFLPRYYLFVYPGLFLSFAWVLTSIFQTKDRLVTSILGFICVLFIIIPIYSLLFGLRIPKWAGERDMSYLRFVQIDKQITTFVEEDFPDRLIVTTWPINSIFEDTLFGYVKVSFDVIDYKECQQLGNFKREFLLITSMVGDVREIEKCAESMSLKLIKNIETVKIYHKVEQ